jgi:hypothetical protein
VLDWNQSWKNLEQQELELEPRQKEAEQEQLARNYKRRRSLKEHHNLVFFDMVLGLESWRLDQELGQDLEQEYSQDLIWGLEYQELGWRLDLEIYWSLEQEQESENSHLMKEPEKLS